MINSAGGMVPFICHIFLIFFGGFFALNFIFNKNFVKSNIGYESPEASYMGRSIGFLMMGLVSMFIVTLFPIGNFDSTNEIFTVLFICCCSIVVVCWLFVVVVGCCWLLLCFYLCVCLVFAFAFAFVFALLWFYCCLAFAFAVALLLPLLLLCCCLCCCFCFAVALPLLLLATPAHANRIRRVGGRREGGVWCVQHSNIALTPVLK